MATNQILAQNFNKLQLKNIPDMKPGDTVKIHQKIKEKDKYRIQIFEGLVIAKKHGKGINGAITVRKVLSGVGVEKTFPLHSPLIDKIEIARRSKVRRSKLYYIRQATGKKARLKRKDFVDFVATKEEAPIVSTEPEKTETAAPSESQPEQNK